MDRWKSFASNNRKRGLYFVVKIMGIKYFDNLFGSTFTFSVISQKFWGF